MVAQNFHSKCNYQQVLYDTFHVKNLTTMYMMKQVRTMPPIRMYLSASDLLSINLMTVLDMPRTEATSCKTFYQLRWGLKVQRWKEKVINIDIFLLTLGQSTSSYFVKATVPFHSIIISNWLNRNWRWIATTF